MLLTLLLSFLNLLAELSNNRINATVRGTNPGSYSLSGVEGRKVRRIGGARDRLYPHRSLGRFSACPSAHTWESYSGGAPVVRLAPRFDFVFRSPQIAPHRSSDSSPSGLVPLGDGSNRISGPGRGGVSDRDRNVSMFPGHALPAPGVVLVLERTTVFQRAGRWT